jgi:hypothetical protein
MKRQVRRTPRSDDKEQPKPAQRLALDFHSFEEDGDGYKSMLLFTDRATGLIWDFYLRDQKGETVATIIAFMLQWYLNQGHIVAVLEADNEILKHEKVYELLLAQKVIVEPSAPRT